MSKNQLYFYTLQVNNPKISLRKILLIIVPKVIKYFGINYRNAILAHWNVAERRPAFRSGD